MKVNFLILKLIFELKNLTTISNGLENFVIPNKSISNISKDDYFIGHSGLAKSKLMNKILI
jgi:hypothetical protein